MKKFGGLSLLIGLVFGVNSVLFAQGGQNPPPPPGEGKMGRPGGPDGPGGMRGGRGGRGGKHRGMRGGMKRGGGFGISDDEIAKLNLTDAQKVKLFDFRKKMAEEREAMRKNFKPGEGMKAEGINREEMRQLMNAKMLGTLTAEQKAKLDGIEAKRKEMMEKRKTEMEAMKAKMEKNHQEFLNIFTLEQRKQLEQMRNERAKQMQDRMKNMPQRGPGGPKNPKPPTNPPTPTE
jgi:Spy/CpxP family protein refolding chaperone